MHRRGVRRHALIWQQRAETTDVTASIRPSSGGTEEAESVGVFLKIGIRGWSHKTCPSHTKKNKNHQWSKTCRHAYFTSARECTEFTRVQVVRRHREGGSWTLFLSFLSEEKRLQTLQSPFPPQHHILSISVSGAFPRCGYSSLQVHLLFQKYEQGGAEDGEANGSDGGRGGW